MIETRYHVSVAKDTSGNQSIIFLSILYMFAPWEIFHAFLSSADFFIINFFKKKSFMITIKVSNSLDPDQA